MNRIKLFDVKWSVDTAGPSPYNNKRTELFFFGCDRAMAGNPCKGCFNSDIWDNSICKKDYSVDEMVDNICRFAPNKYITIGGGEPTAQLDALIELCQKLKGKGFHIMVYTWKSLKTAINSKFEALIRATDIIVDGEFKIEESLYDEDKGDGFLSSVGSGNQIIWDCKAFNDHATDTILKGYTMNNLDGVFLKDNNDLLYIVKDNNVLEEVLNIN